GRRIAVSAFFAAASVAIAGCGGSVASVSGGVVAHDGAYRAVWERGWTAVNRDVIRYLPTTRSPGVCNKGGTKAQCFMTDRRVATDLRWLETNLRRVHSPGPIATPHG